MTFIQPNKNRSVLNKILLLLGIFTVLSSIWLVMLYNKMVNLDHGLSEMKSELSDVQSQNVAIKTKIFNLLNSSDPSSISNLIQEKNPEYVESWSFASDY